MDLEKYFVGQWEEAGIFEGRTDCVFKITLVHMTIFFFRKMCLPLLSCCIHLFLVTNWGGGKWARPLDNLAGRKTTCSKYYYRCDETLWPKGQESINIITEFVQGLSYLFLYVHCHVLPLPRLQQKQSVISVYIYTYCIYIHTYIYSVCSNTSDQIQYVHMNIYMNVRFLNH